MGGSGRTTIITARTPGGGGVPEPKGLKLYDNTRISDFRRCARFFMYRHLFDWQAEGRSLPLIFGGGWHRAMEVVWPALISAAKPDLQAIVKAAYSAFYQHWLDEGLPPVDEMDLELTKEYEPRTPMIAMEMLVAYVSQRISIRHDFELLAIEKPFAVPLDPNDPTLFYVGKIDKIVRFKDRGGRKIGGIEHKTTTAYRKADKLPFRSAFLDSFSPNSQVDGYLFALHMLYPDQVGGVWIDASLVHKSEEGFTYIPIERQLPHLDAWIWETRNYIDQIEANKKALAAAKPTDPYLAAFPKNTNSCHDFNTSCQYLGLCKAWPNPVGKPTPAGYHIEHWNPLEHLDVEQLELPK